MSWEFCADCSACLVTSRCYSRDCPNSFGRPCQCRKLSIELQNAWLWECGWVSGEDLVDRHGNRFMGESYCSVACFNDRVRDGRRRAEFWWFRARGFQGPAPVCACDHVADERGMLRRLRVADCPWHSWEDAYHQLRIKREHDLFELWRDVPLGTAVIDRATGKVGRIDGPPKLVHWEFSTLDSCTALVLVEGWFPHPYASSLALADGVWLPPKVMSLDDHEEDGTP